MRATVGELKKRNRRAINNYKTWNRQYKWRCDECNGWTWGATTGKLIAARALEGCY
ncbi:MAG: hypothetical protein WCS17_10285 [Prevotella sp.]